MFHAPATEAKQQNDPSRSQAMPEPRRELSPLVPASAGHAWSGAAGGGAPPGANNGIRQPFAALHSTFGNQAVLRMLSCPTSVIQTKLTVNQPGDQYEQEADRVADQVMRMADPAAEQSELPRQSAALSIQRIHQSSNYRVQREEVIEEPLPEEEPGVIQSKAQPGGSGVVPAGLESQIHSLRGGGQPLPQSARAFFEPRFGYDFGMVRVHTDGPATQMAQAVNALAFTSGANIVFGAGQYSPESGQGRRLLAHELTHVIQQGSSSESVMRTNICNCPSVGARDPSPAETADAGAKYPNLQNGDWCVTGPATDVYNCIAWTIGVTNRWVWDEVDAAGDNNGTVSVSDFDAFYGARGLTPAVGSPANPQIALFANSTGPTHAARVSSSSCGGTQMFESKRGKNIRILHVVTQLEGGIYGNIVKFYVSR
jgi:hypothetical protein